MISCFQTGQLVCRYNTGAGKIKRWAVGNLGTFTTALHSDTTSVQS
jgi:hypothetical protein